MSQYKAECDRLRAERDNLAAAIERVRKECDALLNECCGGQSTPYTQGIERGIYSAAQRIRSAIGDVGDVPAQQSQEGK